MIKERIKRFVDKSFPWYKLDRDEGKDYEERKYAEENL